MLKDSSCSPEMENKCNGCLWCLLGKLLNRVSFSNELLALRKQVGRGQGYEIK